MSLRRIKYPDSRLVIGQEAANAIDAPRNTISMCGILWGLYVTEGQSSVGASYYRTDSGVGDNPHTVEQETTGTLWIDQHPEPTFRG